MDVLEMERWNVWINSEQKIASFHHIDGYQLAQFTNHDYFLGKVQALIQSGFRFQ